MLGPRGQILADERLRIRRQRAHIVESSEEEFDTIGAYAALLTSI